MRAFSKFCRLIVSIEFPPARPARYVRTNPHHCPWGQQQGRGVLGWQVAQKLQARRSVSHRPARRSAAAARRSARAWAAKRAALATLSPVHCLPSPTTGVMVKARPLPADPLTGQVPFSAPSPLAICPLVWRALGRSMVGLCVSLVL